MRRQFTIFDVISKSISSVELYDETGIFKHLLFEVQSDS